MAEIPSDSPIFSEAGTEEPMDIVFAEPPRSYPVIAWIVIGLLVTAIVGMNLNPPDVAEDQGDSSTTIMMMEFQGRYLVAVSELMRMTKQPPQEIAKLNDEMFRGMEPLNTGTIGQRQRFAILGNELLGPTKGLELLEGLSDQAEENDVTFNPDQAECQKVLTQVFEDYQAGKFSAPGTKPDERAELVGDLGWYGELALAPSSGDDKARNLVLLPAWRLLVTLIGGLLFVGTLGVGGLIGLVLLAVKASTRGTFRFVNGTNRGGLYAETFALWMTLFLVFSLSTNLVDVPGTEMFIQGIAFFGSLLALFWPVLRGVPWKTVREDIGWTGGEKLWMTPFQGIVAYAMTIPMLFVGMIAMLFLIMIQSAIAGDVAGSDSFDPTSFPSHPIVETLREGTLWTRLQILFLASIAAPVVEETVFRGLLYRHLREASRFWGRLWSGIASATVTSFIFAVIHPQGVVAVPALMGIAFGLTLAREKYETILPSMFAHGLHNGLLMLGLMTALG